MAGAAGATVCRTDVREWQARGFLAGVAVKELPGSAAEIVAMARPTLGV
jgi:hypothetical protein